MLGSLQEDIQNILAKDPAARGYWEVLLCYPGLHAVVWHRLAHALWRRGYSTLARCVSHGSRFLTGIEIHPGASIGRRVFIDHGMGVVIGETAVIEDDCTIYQAVTLGGVSLEPGKRHPTLQRGVVVGAGAQVLGPFVVGAGAKIGSNAVVTKPVPAGATMVGNPARMLRADTAAGAVVETPDDLPDVSESKQSQFSAYGLSGQGDDPWLELVDCLIEHGKAQQHRINALEQHLNLDSSAYETAKALDLERLERLHRWVNRQASK